MGSRKRHLGARCCSSEPRQAPLGARKQRQRWMSRSKHDARGLSSRRLFHFFFFCHGSLFKLAILERKISRAGCRPPPRRPSCVTTPRIKIGRDGWEVAMVVVVVWALMSALTSGTSRPLRRSFGPRKPYLDSTAHPSPPPKGEIRRLACRTRPHGRFRCRFVVSALPDSGRHIAGGSARREDGAPR